MTEKALKPIKPFLNYEEQIKNLIERKGMVITDCKFATSKLEDISYFALIDGYKNLFYNPMTRKYREGTTLEDIVALYEFDEKLRALIFQYLCHFE
ncbi:Abi family protein, partial [Blautia luti]